MVDLIEILKPLIKDEVARLVPRMGVQVHVHHVPGKATINLDTHWTVPMTIEASEIEGLTSEAIGVLAEQKIRIALEDLALAMFKASETMLTPGIMIAVSDRLRTLLKGG